MSRRKNATLLAIVRSDCTFQVREHNGRRSWSGKCIHCNTRLDLEEDGTPISPITIEHLRSRNHGGDNDLRNLALCCPSCNQEKGRRIDNRRAGDARMEEVVAAAIRRREERWRE
jgi:5-methylcytosine-specific restriction endonuclease McrA